MIGGIAFSYFVLLPYVMKFMMRLSTDLDIIQTIGINEYFTFLVSIAHSVRYHFPVTDRLAILCETWYFESEDTGENTEVCVFHAVCHCGIHNTAGLTFAPICHGPVVYPL